MTVEVIKAIILGVMQIMLIGTICAIVCLLVTFGVAIIRQVLKEFKRIDKGE